MNEFELGPKEENDPAAEMEELKHGRFSMMDDEKEQIKNKALAEGKDPEDALREHEERLRAATNRLREKQKEEAIENLERDMNRQFLDNKKENE